MNIIRNEAQLSFLYKTALPRRAKVGS